MVRTVEFESLCFNFLCDYVLLMRSAEIGMVRLGVNSGL